LYIKKVSRFLEYLLLNYYLLSSSPLRGEKLVILTFKNNTINSLRNLYFDNDTRLIAINNSYSKSRDLTNINKSNIRFLPYRLSRVTIYYITLLVPFIEYLNFNYLDSKTINTKLFLDNNLNTLSTNLISKLLKIETKKYFNKGFPIRLYRHLITYIIKDRILKDNINLLTPTKKNKYKENTNNIEDILANRSTNISNRNYTRSTNLFINKTRDITNRSVEFIKLYFNFFKLNSTLSIRDILLESYKEDKGDSTYLESSSLSSTSSLSIDLEVISINPTLKSRDILDNNLDTSSSSSSSSSDISNISNSSKSYNSLSKLNKLNLKVIDNLESPTKSKEISNYLEALDSSSKAPSRTNSKSNTNPSIDLNIDLDLDNIEFSPRESRSKESSNSSTSLNPNLDINSKDNPTNLNPIISTNSLEDNSSNIEVKSVNKGGRPRKLKSNKRGRPRKNKR
jgi:hypothetical protein